MSWTNKEGTRHSSLGLGRIPETRNTERKQERGAEKRRRDRGKPAFLIGKRGDFHGLKDKGRGGEE